MENSEKKKFREIDSFHLTSGKKYVVYFSRKKKSKIQKPQQTNKQTTFVFFSY